MKYFLLLIPILCWSCGPDSLHVDFNQESILGYKPIYADSSELNIAMEPAKEIELAGKIYSYGNLLLVNEQGKGVHLYDNTDPKKPINLMYVKIPGNHDIAMKNGVLYADSYGDLLALEIKNDSLFLTKRLEGVMGFSAEFPLENGTYFECVDESKGVVVGWERTELSNPKCYRP